MMPTLQRITLFPIKSLTGHEVAKATVLPSGGLAGDRRYALKDSTGQFISGKRYETLHRIRARYGDDLQSVVLNCDGLDGDGNEETFALEPGNQSIAQWCGDILGMKCQLVENPEGGFPDDRESPGPTLISTATLAEVAGWFDGMNLQEARRRFRMNLEVDGEAPFWEDRLVSNQNKASRFRVGSTMWQGRGICQRCVVPTRSAHTGTVSPGFARIFAQFRQQTLPDWAPAERFDHFYRLGINTALDSIEQGNTIEVGAPVEVLER